MILLEYISSSSTGVNCELDVSVCNASEDGSKKCLNGGRCIEGIGATFTCECAEGDCSKGNRGKLSSSQLDPSSEPLLSISPFPAMVIRC